MAFNKYALILSAVVGGVLTPGPDVLSQLLMAGPLFGLFNLSILLVWMIERARRKKLGGAGQRDRRRPGPRRRLDRIKSAVSPTRKNLTASAAPEGWEVLHAGRIFQR